MSNIFSQWLQKGNLSVKTVLASLVGTIGYMIAVLVNIEVIDYVKLWFLVFLLLLFVLLYWIHCILLKKYEIESTGSEVNVDDV